MKSRTFVEELKTAQQNGYAVAAFNIFNYLSARAVIRAAQKMGQGVILQTSTQTVKRFGPLEIGTMLRQLAWNASVNVIIHLDHCTSVDMAKACIDAGWDSVMFDGSHLTLEDNILFSREVVSYAHARGVFVEGELGRIAGVEDDIAVDETNATQVSLDESIHYVRETGIDALAPAIGTAHGVYQGKPNINFSLVEDLKNAIDAPIVIHGGTGLGENTFKRLIKAGGSKINVSTAIKHAYIDGCKEYFAGNPDKIDPIGFDQFLNCKIGDTAAEHMQIFNGK